MKYWIIWATNDRILIVLKRVSSLLLISIINLVLTRFLRLKIYIPCNLACLLIVLLRLPGCFLHRKLKVSKYALYILTHLFLYVVRIVLKYKIILRKKRHFFYPGPFDQYLRLWALTFQIVGKNAWTCIPIASMWISCLYIILFYECKTNKVRFVVKFKN